jgi:Trp operon repressor
MYSCTGTIAYMKSPVKRVSTATDVTLKDRTRRLYRLILGARDEKALDALLSDLLTPAEAVSITERLAILAGLAKGDTLRDVAKKIHVSIGKVERGSNVYQHGKTDWKKLLT